MKEFGGGGKAELLRHCIEVLVKHITIGAVGPGSMKSDTVSPNARHRYDVSVPPRSLAAEMGDPLLVTRFDRRNVASIMKI